MATKSIQPGDIIRFSYPGGTDPAPVAMYLDNYKGKIHALNFNYMTKAERRYYFLLFKVNFHKHKVKISPLDFYNKYIKTRLRSNAYRTYDPKNMKGVSLVRAIVVGTEKVPPLKRKTS